MTYDEQIALFDEIVDFERNLIKTKGHDYANEDLLSNFKQAASFANVTPQEICRGMIGVKIARLQNLWNKPAKNESLNDTLTDLRTYIFLYKCLENETKK